MKCTFVGNVCKLKETIGFKTVAPSSKSQNEWWMTNFCSPSSATRPFFQLFSLVNVSWLSTKQSIKFVLIGSRGNGGH